MRAKTFRFTTEQKIILEKYFTENRCSVDDIIQLGKGLKIPKNSAINWFNRRKYTKRYMSLNELEEKLEKEKNNKPAINYFKYEDKLLLEEEYSKNEEPSEEKIKQLATILNVGIQRVDRWFVDRKYNDIRSRKRDNLEELSNMQKKI